MIFRSNRNTTPAARRIPPVIAYDIMSSYTPEAGSVPPVVELVDPVVLVPEVLDACAFDVGVPEDEIVTT